MNLPKPQEPWIGARGRIGVIIPSTNIAVEYDCQRILPAGVTWHFARFHVAQPDLSSDDMFLAFIEAIRTTIPDAMRDIMTCEPSHIMMGMSAETFWGGLQGNVEFEQHLRSMIGPQIGLTSGAAALKAALDAFGAKNVAALTPYQPVADLQVRRFLEESGYNVTNVVGLKCDSATSIAHTPRREIIDTVLRQLEGDNVDAIVQAGTNISALDIFPTLERQLGKPIIAINVANIWHTLRAHGIADKVFGRGMLLERM
ncbi:MAG: Asp/Glu racemase [Burkholderiaceae bacterium]|nr:MAG: Asp/Glu racemase [Burkholderiaceae bacterium]TAM07657.1 MAG: Asp/Glu racemase [Pusillimonas sp.]